MQRLELAEELTIYTAMEYKSKLLAFLAQGDELELDLFHVQEIDTAGLQLLILIKREAANAGKKLSFTMHSKAVLAALELTNLAFSFGDQIVLAHSEE